MLNLKKLVQMGKKHRLLKIPVLAILLTAMTVAEGLQLMCAAFSRRSVRRMAAILTAACVITVGLPMDSLAAVSSAGENGGAIQETQTEESPSAQQPSEESKAEEPKATASDSWNPDHSQIQGESDEESSQEEAFDPQEDTELIDDVNGAGQTESETNPQEVPGGGYEKTDAMLAVTAMIDALPAAEELDGLNLGDEGFIDHINSLKTDAAAAMAAYDALSQEEQENFPSEELHKLTALEAALEAVLPTVNLLTLPQMNGLTNGVVTIKINDGPETGGDNLEAAIGATDLSTITSLEVTAGEVTNNDWAWFQSNRESFTSLQSFETAAGVPVAVMPGGGLQDPPEPTTFPSSIVSVSMPELQEIGQGAFAGCSNLKTINFPQVTTMDLAAFAYCTKLEEANFPKLYPQLPKQAFYHCTALARVNFPLVTKLGWGAFYQCEALTNVSFPELLTIPENPDTGNFTFKNCTALRSVSMPKLGEMRYTAFDGCTSLTMLKLPANPPKIDGLAFQNCPTSRTLTLVASDGTPLTGEALSRAQTAYDSATDNGNVAGDHLWYGWTLKDNTSGFVPKNGGVTLDKANHSIYANGNAITAIQGADSGDTKLYYTDDPAQTIIDLDSMVDPNGLTGNTVDGYRMVWSPISGRQTGIQLYGGSNSIPITGGTSITIEGGYIEEVCGGGKGDDGTPASSVAVDSASIAMSGGTVNNMTGGGYKGDVTGDIKVTVTGGTVLSLTGGSTRAAVGGNVTINLTECRISLVSPGSSGKNVPPVSGTISLAVGGAAKIGGMLSGDGILVKNGFFFALTNSFTGSVVCNLPADYTGGTLITNVQVSDLDRITLTGPGAEHAAKTHSGDKLVVTITQPGPSGSVDDPYLIKTSGDLAKLAADVAGGTTFTGKFFKIANDAVGDLQATTAIGSKDHPFEGTFDGNGKSVALAINAPTTDYQGLFGLVDGGTVKNLGVTGSVVGANYVGGVAGCMDNGAAAENCFSTAAVTGGGDGFIDEGYSAGGVAGKINHSSTVKNCYATGDVASGGNSPYEYTVGGVVGAGRNSSIIEGCYSTGTITGSMVGSVLGYSGPIGLGEHYGASIKNSIALGAKVTMVEGRSDWIHRLLGYGYRVPGTSLVLENNKARADMVIGSEGSEKTVSGVKGDANGADTALGTALSTVFSGWDPSVWTIPAGSLTENNPLPTLKNFTAAQNPVLPPSQGGGGTPGGDAEASWQISGGSGGSGTVEEAFTALQGKTGVITLLKDMTNPTIGGGMDLPTVVTSGNVTLDINGKQVDHFQTGVQGQRGTLTIKDSVGGGKLLQSDSASALLTCAGGTLKVESGVFEGKAPKYGALYVSAGIPKPVVELSGGIFAGAAGQAAIKVVSLGEDPTFSWSKILSAGKKLDPDTVSHVTEGSLVTYSSASTVVVKDSGVAPPAPTGGELKAPLTQPNVDQVFGPGNAAVNTSPNPPVITLNQDVVVDAPIVVKSPVKADINLNGHTITGKPGAAVNPVITVGSGADVTVTGPGSVTGGDGANSGNGGDGIKVESGGKLETGGGAVIEGGAGGTGNSGGNGITGDGDVIIGGGSSVTGGTGGNSGAGAGGDGGHGITGSGDITIGGGSSVTGGTGGTSGAGTGGAGGNGADSSGSGNVVIDSGSVAGGAGGGSTEGAGGTGGTGASSQSGSITVDTGASSSGGAGGSSSHGNGGAGGAGTGTATGEITVNSDSVTGGTGGTSDTGDGGKGGAGADSSQSGNVVIHNGGGVTGGAGGGSTGGTGGAGGTGANSQSGNVTVDTGASSSGGAGGNSAGGSGGAGGSGTSTGPGGTTTVGGETTGGQGGSGTGTGNGGDGGSGTVIDSGTTAAGSGTATGGDGGNIPGDGSGMPGQGGPGVQGGSPGSVKPTHGQNGVKVTAIVEASQAGTTVTAAKQDLVNAVPITQEDIDHNREIKVELKVEKKDNQPDKDAVEAARPGNASTVGAYFDISLLKTVTESGMASPPETITATQPGSTISITITIPADMRGGSNYTVIRVHGGQGTSLPTSQSGNDLTFQTDQFSTYAIAYTPSGGGSGGGGSGGGGSGGGSGSGGSGGGSGSGGSGGGGSSTDSGGNEYGSSTHSLGSGSSGPGVVNGYEPPFIVSGPTKENPSAPVTVQTNINTAADASGHLDINHLDAVLNAALNKAGTEASKGGNGIVVNVQFGAEALTADTVSINLPKSVQEKIIGEQLQAFQLISQNPALTLRFDLEAIKNIWQQANSDVRITITRLTSLAGLPEEFITEAGSRPVYRIGLVCDNGNRTLSTLSAGELTVGIPYTPGQGESEDLLYAISVTPDNQTGCPANPDYNRIQKELVFSIPYLGVFGIGEGEAAKNRRKKTRHTVKAGDTLWALAKRYDCSVAALMEVNHIDNPKRLHVGQQLIIPS